MLSKSEKQLIQKRWFLQKIWPWAVGGMFALWFGFCVYAYLKVPMLANPVYLMDKMQNNQLETSTLYLLAGMSPVLFITTSLVVTCLLIAIFDFMKREESLLKIIQTLRERKN